MATTKDADKLHMDNGATSIKYTLLENKIEDDRVSFKSFPDTEDTKSYVDTDDEFREARSDSGSEKQFSELGSTDISAAHIKANEQHIYFKSMDITNYQYVREYVKTYNKDSGKGKNGGIITSQPRESCPLLYQPEVM